MYKTLSLILMLLLCACSQAGTLAAPTQELTPDDIATQVSLLLTTMPTATAPIVLITATPGAETTSEAPQAEETAVEQTAEATATLAATNTQEATNTQTTEPQPTQTASPAASPTAAVQLTATEVPPNWRDTLDTGDNFYLYDNGNTRISHENGHLVLTGINANGWMGWSLTYGQPRADFRLRAVLQPQTCSGGDIYGLVFRASSANAGYFFGVTCDGRYSLTARNFDDGSSSTLVELTESSAIQQGSNSTNRLEVRANGTQIGLYVNNTLLEEVTDSTYTSGYFGAFVAANNTSGFNVWMDEIALWYTP